VNSAASSPGGEIVREQPQDIWPSSSPGMPDVLWGAAGAALAYAFDQRKRKDDVLQAMQQRVHLEPERPAYIVEEAPPAKDGGGKGSGNSTGNGAVANAKGKDPVKPADATMPANHPDGRRRVSWEAPFKDPASF